MKPFFVTLSLLASFAPAVCGQISAPAAGFVRYGGLPVQAVYGIAGNLIASPAAWGPADAVCFGKTGGLMAAGGHIQLVSLHGPVLADYPSDERHAIFAIGDTLASAVAWLPSSDTLLLAEDAPGTQSGVRFQAVRLYKNALATDVTSVSLTGPQTVRLLASQADGAVVSVTVSVPGGEIKSEEVVPGLRAPAYEFNRQFIWADNSGFEIGTPEGVRETLRPPVAGPFRAERMSTGWIHLHFAADASADWALNLSDLHPSLFRLPAPAAKGGSRQ